MLVANNAVPSSAQTPDFVTYLKEQDYLLGVTDVDEHGTDSDKAKVSYHSVLTPVETRGLIEDDNVTVDRIDFASNYVTVLDDR